MSRYSQKGDAEKRHMLETIGVAGIDDLFTSIPKSLRLSHLLDLPAAHSEDRLIKTLAALASKNRDFDSCASFLGAGMYDHFVPTAVRAVASRSEFATAYTPYQGEMSQGTLQTIFEFQTMMCELTGLDVANASLYDGGSGVAEAILLSCGAKRRSKVLMAPGVHPFYREVAATYCSGGDIDIVDLADDGGRLANDSLADSLGDDVACVVVQHPNVWGLLEDMPAISDAVHRHGALLVAVVDPVSLGILAPPGEYDADIAVGEGQALGNFVSYGGPGYGFFAARKEHLRRLPGRLVGQTLDRNGRRGFVLTLQTREQHIRRERATSNICTNQGLMATAAAIFMSLLGPQGIREMAEQCAQKAHFAAGVLAEAGAKRIHDGPFFREFCVTPPIAPRAFVDGGLDRGLLAGIPMRDLDPSERDGLLITVTERRTRSEIDTLADWVRNANSTPGVLEEAPVGDV